VSPVTAVLFDLDSTLRDSRHRHYLSPAVNPDSTWHDYSAAGVYDAPMPGPITALRLLHEFNQVHIVSGSNESARDLTMGWLTEHIGLEYIDHVALRADGDFSPNGLLKVNYARQLEQDGTKVVLFWEDWPSAAEELEKAGYPVVCVNPRYPCLACGADAVKATSFPSSDGIGGGRLRSPHLRPVTPRGWES
jgi:beta-phosphoglucomutase-like phosphatase (HAD superfamily)